MPHRVVARPSAPQGGDTPAGLAARHGHWRVLVVVAAAQLGEGGARGSSAQQGGGGGVLARKRCAPARATPGRPLPRSHGPEEAAAI